jgi:hypothetical protein
MDHKKAVSKAQKAKQLSESGELAGLLNANPNVQLGLQQQQTMMMNPGRVLGPMPAGYYNEGNLVMSGVGNSDFVNPEV